jgi:hypothetical protein
MKLYSPAVFRMLIKASKIVTLSFINILNPVREDYGSDGTLMELNSDWEVLNVV